MTATGSQILTDGPHSSALVCLQSLHKPQAMLGRSGLGSFRIEGLCVGEVGPNALLVDMLGARLFALRDVHSGQIRVS